MKQFIQLSSCVINKSHIIQIRKKPIERKYYIYMTNHMSQGLFYTFWFHLEICEKKEKKDYDTITSLLKEASG